MRGLGAACQIWWGGGGPPAHALVRMGHDGVVTVVTGTQDIGTGVTTAFAMVAAEELGLPLDRVRVEVGSTRYGVFAPVSGGSQTMPSVAPAVRSAAYDVSGKLLELAGDVFEVSPDDLRIVDGEFVSLDGALREPVTEVTGKLGQAQLVGTGSRGPNPEGMRVNTFGCQIAQVAVDAATGEIAVERIVAVHDIGRVISPLQARSQVEGGVLQGLGFALMEERVVDPTTGTVVNANLEDYKLPTHADCPEIVVDFIDKPDPHASTLGLKGLGEPPIVPTAAAIANAVFHATGVRVRTLADHAPALARGARAVSAYVRPGTLDEALELLDAPAAHALAGGTDLVPLQARGKAPGTLVDVRAPARRRDRAHAATGSSSAPRRASPTSPPTRVIAERYAALSQAAGLAASPQLRNQGTVGGNLAQHVRCWYYRHPDLTCWLDGGDTCYAQIGDHRKHGLEPGDCISVAPSDLAGALLAWAPRVRVAGAGRRAQRCRSPSSTRARPRATARPCSSRRGELITAVELPAPPDASAYERAGERAAWSFALAGVAAARFGDDVRLAAIGLTNEPRLLDPADPLAGLPGLEQTGWKRELAGVLCERALARVAPR